LLVVTCSHSEVSDWLAGGVRVSESGGVRVFVAPAVCLTQRFTFVGDSHLLTVLQG